MNVCSVEDCGTKVYSRGYCQKHYTRQRRTGGATVRRNFAYEPLPVKLSQYAESSGGCWEWTAGLNSMGYGTIYHDKKKRYAHRLSYELHNGIKISDKILVLHKCDNPKCINPSHLFLGNARDNSDDMWAKGRGARGESKSNIFTEADIIDMRNMSAQGIRQRDIIKKYNSHQATMSAILRRVSWAWLVQPVSPLQGSLC